MIQKVAKQVGVITIVCSMTRLFSFCCGRGRERKSEKEESSDSTLIVVCVLSA